MLLPSTVSPPSSSSFSSSFLLPNRRRSLRLFAIALLVLFGLTFYLYPSIFGRAYFVPATAQVNQEPASQPRVHQIHTDPSLYRTIFHTGHSTDSHREPPANLTLVLSITNDTRSWGRMTRKSQQVWTFGDYISRIRQQGLSPESVHLGILTSDLTAYGTYIDELASSTDLPFARAEIIYLPSLPCMTDSTSEGQRKDRHTTDHVKQSARRRRIARIRNFLSSHMLTPAVQHVIWLDADVYDLPAGLFSRLVELGSIPADRDIKNIVKYVDTSVHTTSTAQPTASAPKKTVSTATSAVAATGKEKTSQTSTPSAEIPAPLPIGLITLRCQDATHFDFDRNAWAGFGRRPSYPELRKLLNGVKLPGMEGWAKSLSQLIKGTTDDQIVKLDAVGGTALYIRAELLREGLVFPPYAIAGTHWGSDGEDGVETEGLCYMAEMMGWGCYTLGGQWRTLHADA
ncbi:hypothetical protein DRE_03535 [Drechslerella stenobrocha 248]|uniref:Glycosyltransferase family 62 protein n=1 Tax=Drechslerella stenobrocha 248 TaxID=1043628 RepID=W7HSV6_9PEZI|nr:hypothetical protein DRE_03535 [Drechslerella stenobrocha 248]